METVRAESCHQMTELVGITNYINRRDAPIAHVERGGLEHVTTINAYVTGQAVDRRGAQQRWRRRILATQPGEQAKRSLDPAHHIGVTTRK